MVDRLGRGVSPSGHGVSAGVGMGVSGPAGLLDVVGFGVCRGDGRVVAWGVGPDDVAGWDVGGLIGLVGGGVVGAVGPGDVGSEYVGK